MLGLIKEKLFGGQSSKHRAKSRLHFVLVQDRTGLTSEDMAKFREEMIAVIDKYFVIDKQAFDVSYKRDSQSTTLSTTPISSTPKISCTSSTDNISPFLTKL